MINKEEIEEDMELAHRVKRVTDYIVDKVQTNGEMTYYDEDVMYIIKYFLNHSMKQLSATEMTLKQGEYLIHQEEIKYLNGYINTLKDELQNQKEINKEHQKLNGELQKKITKLEEINKGKSIQEMGVSNLYEKET